MLSPFTKSLIAKNIALNADQETAGVSSKGDLHGKDKDSPSRSKGATWIVHGHLSKKICSSLPPSNRDGAQGKPCWLVSVLMEQWRALFGVWITSILLAGQTHCVTWTQVRESAWAASVRNRTHFPTHIHVFHFSSLLFSPLFSIPFPPLPSSFLFQKAPIQVAPRAACVVELFSCRAAISWQQLVGELGSRSCGDLSAGAYTMPWELLERMGMMYTRDIPGAITQCWKRLDHSSPINVFHSSPVKSTVESNFKHLDHTEYINTCVLSSCNNSMITMTPWWTNRISQAYFVFQMGQSWIFYWISTSIFS